MKERESINSKLDALNIADFDKAAITLKELSQQQKSIASEGLASLGTTALQYSLGMDYEMQIDLGGTPKSPKADLWVVKDGNKEDPLSDNGGGIVDIIGTSMRLVILNNYNDPEIDGPIILDEPFKMVSKEYIPLLSEFISKISEDFGRQIIIVTHNEFLSSMTDSNVYVSLDDKYSTVDVIKNESR